MSTTAANFSSITQEEKPKSVLKGLRHGLVGMGTTYAVSSLITAPLRNLKIQQQLTEGLVHMETLPDAPLDTLSHVQRMDVIVAILRGVTPYSLNKLLGSQFADKRAMRATTAMLTSVAVAMPEMWRLESHAELYSQQLATGQHPLSLIEPRGSEGEEKTVGAVIKQVAPFVLYEVTPPLSSHPIIPQ